MRVEPERLKMVVGIATAGRRETLSNALRQLGLQSRPPDLLVVCPAKPEDCDEAVLERLPFPTQLVRGPIGLTNQRNTILSVCENNDVIAFFDDDFYADPAYLAEAEKLLLRRQDVVGITGRPVADGNLTPGIPHQHALQILAEFGLHLQSRGSGAGERSAPDREYDVYSLYGCNMVMRMQPIRSAQLQFDPRLPLYSWLEDVDFTRRIASFGPLVGLDSMFGVHLAEKRGRTSGVRFGYSQVANPIYLMRKGTMAPSKAMAQTARNLARNLQRFAFPEEWVDRRGRVRGNLMAIVDLLRGRMRPENITELG
jgi:hypothetical protein